MIVQWTVSSILTTGYQTMMTNNDLLNIAKPVETGSVAFYEGQRTTRIARLRELVD